MISHNTLKRILFELFWGGEPEQGIDQSDYDSRIVVVDQPADARHYWGIFPTLQGFIDSLPDEANVLPTDADYRKWSNNNVLDTGQAAMITGLAQRTITNACARGELPARKTAKNWLIFRDDLTAWRNKTRQYTK